MTARTQLIFTDNPGDLPASYRVPASLEIVVSSVFARFDGSGAGGDFLATLDILSQSGNLISRVAVNSQTLAAGDSARVTWAPFLRRASAATPPPPSGTTIFELEGTSTFNTTGGGDVVAWSDQSVFNDGTYFDFDGSSEVEILGAGAYLFHWLMAPSVNNAGVSTSTIQQVDVVAGSQGQWSSKYPGGLGNEGFSETLWRIVDTATALDVVGGSQGMFVAMGTWASTDTFPVTVRCTADKLEDGSSVVGQLRNRITVTRIGTPFE